MPKVEPLVQAVTARLRPLEIAANQAWWLASTAVSDEHERRRVSADIALRDALGDVTTFGEIRDAPRGPPPGRRGPRASAAPPPSRRATGGGGGPPRRRSGRGRPAWMPTAQRAWDAGWPSFAQGTTPPRSSRTRRSPDPSTSTG